MVNRIMERTDMQQPLSEWLDLHEAEKTTGIRADALRKAARAGKLRTVRVAGPRGPHLVHKDDLEAFSSFLAGNQQPQPNAENV